MKVHQKIIACSATIREKLIDGSFLPQNDFFSQNISANGSQIKKKNPQTVQKL